MSAQNYQDIGSHWCPDCGNEMNLNGVQPAGYAQFFCEYCRYRRDRFVGAVADDQSEE
jgi:transposase-like protein